MCTNCSPHPRKRKQSTLIQPDTSGEFDNQQQPSSSKYHQADAEFVPVSFEEASEKKSPYLNSHEELSAGKHPLLEENLAEQSRFCDLICIKSEPISDEEDQRNQQISGKNFLNGPNMSSVPSQNPVNVDDKSNMKEPFCQTSSTQKMIPNSSPTINHRKRRLLQLDLLDCTTSLKSTRTDSVHDSTNMETRRIPRLQPIIPLKAYLNEFLNLARAKGLLTLSLKDDCGNEWAEIRQSVAAYRVPKYGYPTHLSRLIVDSSLQYYLEVLGHCIQKGSLLNSDAGKSFNFSEAVSVLRSFDEGHDVCSGIELLSDRFTEFHIKTIQNLGYAENMYATLPDHRYRSLECSQWIDRKTGPRCAACKLATNEYSATPIDLRCSSSQHLFYEH